MLLHVTPIEQHRLSTILPNNPNQNTQIVVWKMKPLAYREFSDSSSCNGERTLHNLANAMAASISCVWMLVVLVVSSCGGSFVSTYCGGEWYNHSTKICCYDEIRERPSDWLDVNCCVTEVYNPATHMCCQQINYEESFIVERKAGESGSVTCSKAKPMAKINHS
ncbi:hypothetical protein LSAT2_010287 [Lamellibrachia satsuma]|nr:hypothetical protein LSAT2_010287 [Lamellibrachia satsuma]